MSTNTKKKELNSNTNHDLPYTVSASAGPGILVRTVQDPLSMMNAVRHEIWETDPGVALSHSGSLEGSLRAYGYAGPRFGFLLMTKLGSIGLVLVTIGCLAFWRTPRREERMRLEYAWRWAPRARMCLD